MCSWLLLCALKEFESAQFFASHLFDLNFSNPIKSYVLSESFNSHESTVVPIWPVSSDQEIGFMQ